MYGDFFEPPPRPFKEEKRPAKGKKGKGINPKPVSAPTPIVAGSSSTILSASTSGGKRSVKFSEIVKVKAIPARGSEFDKLVAKVGWEKAEEITKKLEAEQTEDMSAEDEDQTFGQDEDDEEGEMDEGEEDEMLKMLAEEQDEMMDDEDDEEEDLDAEEGSEEYESDDEEGRETIARLKQSLFEEDEPSEDEDATPGPFISHPRDGSADISQRRSSRSTSDACSRSLHRSRTSRRRTSAPRTGRPRERPSRATDRSTRC